MKIVFLQLSDLHLQDSHGIHPAKVQAIVDSISLFAPFQGIVIILSGDIAATGQANQYKIAAVFLGRLTSALKRKYSLTDKNAKILIVPGNHDINWGGESRLDSSKIHAFTEEKREQHLHRELMSMESYFSFSDKNKCFFAFPMNMEFGRLITRKILHFDERYRIEANLINTAPFSCASDDGLHYLPEDAIQSLKKASAADLSIVIMHHSPDWFEFSQKKELESIIAQRCSIAFYGHEHLSGTQDIFYDNGNHIIKQAGGAWWQSSAPMFSEYYAAVFDTESKEYFLRKFSWVNDRLAFLNTQEKIYTLTVKPLYGTKLIYQEKHIAEVMKDEKNTIPQKISDYFIFPTLRFNVSEEYSKSKTIMKMEDFLSFIKENKYIAITGGSNCGKTTLLKMLFKELQSQYIALYCGTDDITGRSRENILKELVQNTYGKDSYSIFQSVPSDRKVIIIDDIHRISEKHLNKFLRGIEEIFDTIIVASTETSEFDIVQLVKDNIKGSREFRKVTITRLYAEKRLSLIKKIVSLKSNDDNTQAAGIVRTLNQCLNSYKLAFRADIDFVVQFVDYYCEHIGELDKSDATVFSKVFEASIERAIVPHLKGRRENPNDIIVALSEVAHYIHFNKAYPVSAMHIDEVIKSYCEYYDNRYLTADRFIDIAVNSGLLAKTSSGYQYRFANKNHLAYFVAKALNRKFHDTGDPSDLETIVKQSCFGINGDILLFMTYISDNVNIPRLLLKQAVSYVSDWSEFDISNITIKYLQAIPNEKINPPPADERDKELHDKAIDEEEHDTPIETLDIYDYDETKIDELNNQLIRAFLQLKIIARNFSAFISILPAQAKKEYVLAMYKLPNKIFNQWSESIDNGLDRFVEEIITWQEESNFGGKKLSRDDILHFFQNISLNMLLNLYHLVSSFGANNNTVDYLAQQDYIPSSLNYRIERLMFWEKVDDYQAVIKEAELLYNKRDNGMINNMVLSVLRHMLVHSDKILDREKRRISGTYFGPEAQTKILIDRKKEKGI